MKYLFRVGQLLKIWFLDFTQVLLNKMRGERTGNLKKFPRWSHWTQKLENLPPYQAVRVRPEFTVSQATRVFEFFLDFSTLYASEHKDRENQTSGCSSEKKKKKRHQNFFFKARLTKGRSRLRTVFTFLSYSYGICQDWIAESSTTSGT